MRVQFVAMAATLALLGGCGSKDGGEAPKGQVVATVAGKEITASQLRLEMGDAPRDPAAAAAAQQAALQSLISRALLADAARERKLDQSPMAAMAKERAEELALVQLLQMSLASGVPKVSDEEVTNFITDHPTSFSQRKLISVDQLVVPQVPMALVRQMEPLKTMAEISSLLDANKVQYVRSASVLDTLSVNPEAAAKISALGTDEVFISPAGGGGISVSRITGSRTEPLAGPEAERAARIMLSQQRSGKQVQESIQQILKAGQSKVKINDQYKPKPPAKPAAAAGAAT